MNLRFAFAVNKSGDFQKKHFGDADKYIIYEHDSKELIFIDEIENTKRDIDEETEHGSKRKGNEIIEYLKNFDVKVLVSMQFGKNIKMVDKHFIPVIVSNNKLNEVIDIIEKNVHWINDEAKNKEFDYMIFRINNGIFKQKFEKYKNN
ncbi:MAG: hypothetical protein K8R54_08805 [Bacteroidales bacterium]|nr:hypothetical protein [Bacteroidales bacterium]